MSNTGRSANAALLLAWQHVQPSWGANMEDLSARLPSASNLLEEEKVCVLWGSGLLISRPSSLLRHGCLRRSIIAISNTLLACTLEVMAPLTVTWILSGFSFHSHVKWGAEVHTALGSEGWIFNFPSCDEVDFMRVGRPELSLPRPLVKVGLPLLPAGPWRLARTRARSPALAALEKDGAVILLCLTYNWEVGKCCLQV